MYFEFGLWYVVVSYSQMHILIQIFIPWIGTLMGFDLDSKSNDGKRFIHNMDA